MNKFFENLPIYYINLKHRTDRNSLMLEQFKKLKIFDYYRIEAINKNDVVESHNMSKSEVACSMSHIYALIEFLKSDNDFAMICEDDSDFFNSLKIDFNFYELINNNDQDYCLQTSLTTREEDFLLFKIKSRSFWDFGTMSYIINKNYAKKIVDVYFLNNYVNFDNFQSRKINDPRGGTINTRPVADELIYSLCDVKVFPLFTFNVVKSDIGSSDEYQRQFVKSRKEFLDYWNNIKNIKINDIIL